MAFERYLASSETNKPPRKQYQEDWQELVNQQIGNAYNWYDIEIEQVPGTQEYVDIKARVSYALAPGTGTKLSDDWKQLIFQNPLDNYARMGKRFRYYDNIWLTVNSERYGSPSENCIVHRCNNTLNFLLTDGCIHQEPCVIDNNLKYGNIYYNNSVNVAQGTIYVWVQMNQYTKHINVNDRFILGYNKVFKVKAITNYLSENTFIHDGAPIIKLEMQVDSTLSTDDFENRITYSTPNDFITNDAYIKITPNINYIALTETVTFKCEYYFDNIKRDNEFTFSIVDSGIPEYAYVFTIIDGNTFSVKNNQRHLLSKLQISCVHDTNPEFNIIHDIELGGAY